MCLYGHEAVTSCFSAQALNLDYFTQTTYVRHRFRSLLPRIRREESGESMYEEHFCRSNRESPLFQSIEYVKRSCASRSGKMRGFSGSVSWKRNCRSNRLCTRKLTSPRFEGNLKPSARSASQNLSEPGSSSFIGERNMPS